MRAKTPFGGLATACVSAFFALLIPCQGETASTENDIPAWFRSKLVNSKFCAICEVSESSSTPTVGTYKIVQLFRGHPGDLPKSAIVFFPKTTLGQNVLIYSSHAPVKSIAYGSIGIENDAVSISVDPPVEGVGRPSIWVPLSRIAQILKTRH